MKWGLISILGALALTTALNARAAESDGDPPGLLGDVHPEVAARMMVGAALTPLEGAPGPGFGVRGGASYLGFYGGLSFTDFMSEHQCQFSSPDPSPGGCGSTHAALYGLELGYGKTFLQVLMVRAELGVGDYALTSDSTSTTCTDTLCNAVSTTASHASRNNLYLAPGALLAVTLGPVLVGLDANIYYMPSAAYPAERPATYSAFMGGAQLGVKL
jgi:hypothetical protein